MTRQGWAERKMAEKVTGYHWNGRIRKSTVILPSIAAKLLKAEHARSVRIVRREIKIYETLKKNYPEDPYWNAKMNACLDILTALQRGRGGKG